MKHIPYTELELVDLLKKNDVDAFSFLYDKYSGSIYGTIYRMVDDTKLVKGIFIKVFIKIWDDIKYFDENKSTLFTWMNFITRNTAKKVLQGKVSLNKMDLSQTNIIDLTYKYTNQEIADYLNVPLPTVTTLIQDALLKFRTGETTGKVINLVSQGIHAGARLIARD